MLPPRSGVLEILQRVPLFSDLSPAEMASVAEGAAVRRYEAGEIVFCEGEKGGDLLIVREGHVRVVKTAASGRQQLIAIERPGSSLGEVSVFDSGPYSATAIAVTSVVVLCVRGEHLRNLCLRHPEVALKVIRVLGHRLRKTRRLIEELSFATVRERLIVHLLELAEHGVKGPDGIEIRLTENNEELAARLGTVRELVSRNLGRLHGEGLITMRKRALTIPSEAALRSTLETHPGAA